MIKKTYKILGMHCKSCEINLESAISEISGIKNVHANHRKNHVIVNGDDFNESEIFNAIVGAGYRMSSKEAPFISFTKRDAIEWVIVTSVFIIFLWGFVSLGFGKIFDIGNFTNSNLGTVFLLGITAGLSTCMALVGGLVLAVSAEYAERHPEASATAKIKNQVIFNTGRVVSFFILGGLMGIFGSFLKLSPFFSAILTILVGALMIAMGLKLIELFPRLSGGLTLPKFLTKALKLNSKESRSKNSFILGALTFFLPCGFTQAMQIYAISTGNFISGSLIMGVFALGTTPGILGIGAFASSVKNKGIGRAFFKFVGVLVIIFGVINLSNGYRLSGISNFSFNEFGSEDSISTEGGPADTSIDNSSQSQTEAIVHKAEYYPEDYQETIKPSTFQAKVGKPIIIEILAKGDGLGCMGSVMVPGYINEPQFFEEGKTVTLKLVPKKKGKIKITCAMGVPSGLINVNELGEI